MSNNFVQQISPWRKRDNFSVARHQELVDGVNLAGVLAASGGIEVAQGTVRDSRGTIVEDVFVGQIVDAGPNGEPDWTDARYFVQRKIPVVPTTTTNPITMEDDPNPESEMTAGATDGSTAIDNIVTATHAPELAGATHGLRVGQFVNVLVVYTYKDDQLYKVYLLEPIDQPLHFGKIQSVAGCNAFAIVKECNEAGSVIYSDTLITVNPTKGGCDSVANGYCYTVGDVIAFVFSPEDPTEAYQVGASRTVSVGLRCSDTNSAAIPGLNRMVFYNTDFFLKAESDCGGSNTNVAAVFARGNIVLGYNTICGATNTAGTGGVKVFDFDTAGHPGGVSYTTNHARVAFDISCATTTDNVPTIGGGPCTDESLPMKAGIIGYLNTDSFIQTITGATGVCNTNTGNIDITITYTTARAAVGF